MIWLDILTVLYKYIYFNLFRTVQYFIFYLLLFISYIILTAKYNHFPTSLYVKEINEFRHQKMLERTKERRPDLFEKYNKKS